MDKTKAVLAHFRKTDPVMFSMAKNTGIIPVQPQKPSQYFYSLCYAIIGQQLSGSAAKSIFTRFENLFPGGKITPERAAKLKEKSIREIGTSWAKARYIIDLGQKVSNGDLNLKTVAKMKNAEAIEALTRVKGVGPWTAEMFLMFTMGREDIFSHGDLGLRKAIIKNYSLKSPSKEKIERISAKWSPYRTYACRTLWKSLDSS
ncbi:MAG: DNA-3-methyladenine glycosylase [archaeon GW2011_AR5]|nr:MAG: DNA-3-methyladenine glycosylase [archaeon GW2011_AR5]